MKRMAVAWVFTVFLANVAFGSDSDRAVAFKDESGRIAVLIGGRPFTNFYHGAEWDKPFLHPLRAANGFVVSRGFPLEKVEGESTDHQWHRGILYGHGDVNGMDFWREKTGDPKQDKKLPLPVGRIVCRGQPKTHTGENSGTLQADCDFTAPDGKSLGTLCETYGFRRDGDNTVIDAMFAIHADKGQPIKMGDTEEGAFSVRLADPFRQDRGCVLSNSDGLVGTEKIWGKRARWVDYSTRLQNRWIGVAIFDHPQNPKHPTWWHARPYGLCNANPFGERDFTGDKSRNGSVAIPAGDSLVFRYRVVIHPGDAKSAEIEKCYKSFATP